MSVEDELRDFLITTDRRMAYYNQLEFIKQEYYENTILTIDGHLFVANLALLQWAEWALRESEERGLDTTIVLDQNNVPVMITDIPLFHEKVSSTFHKALNRYHTEYSKLQKAKNVREIVEAVETEHLPGVV